MWKNTVGCSDACIILEPTLLFHNSREVDILMLVSLEILNVLLLLIPEERRGKACIVKD